MSPVVESPTATQSADVVEIGALAGYRRGVAEVQRKVDREQQLPLQPGAESRLLVHDMPPKRGSVVMLHGFTAGTWQYDEMSKILFEQGFNVYVPRVVGHGFANEDGTQDGSQLPRSGDSHRFDDFAEETFLDLKKLGGPLKLVGFSGGGAVGTRILENHPDIERAVLVAPFYRPKSELARNVIWGSGLVDPWSFGAAGLVLDRLDHDMGLDEDRAMPEWERPGHRFVKLGNIYALGQLGGRAIEDAKKIETPVQFITTGADWAIHTPAVHEVFDAAGGEAKHSWYHFGEAEQVVHSMFHGVDNQDPSSYVKSRDMILDYITDAKTADMPPDTGSPPAEPSS